MKLSDFLTDLGRPVAYYPGLALALGDAKEAIFLCQMSYWKGKEQDGDGWIYKESVEITRETGLSYKEQINVRKGLVQKKLMIEHYARTEHRMYFKIDWDAVNTWWEGHMTDGHMPKRKVVPAKRSGASLPTGKWYLTKGHFPICPFVISLNGISETTPEITPETTREGEGISLPKIWETVLNEIKTQTPRASFDRHVQPTQAVRYDGNTLFVRAATVESCEWLAARVQRSAERLLIGVLNQEVAVSFLVSEEVK